MIYMGVWLHFKIFKNWLPWKRITIATIEKIMFFNICKFHLQFWQMCKLFANKLFSLNTYFYSSVWIIMVHSNFDAKNLHSICLRISPQIFAIVQNFAMDNLRDQQFCTLMCELERLVVVLFTGLALEVEVPPGMVCVHQCHDWRTLIFAIFPLLTSPQW